jgi:hypothetical protein
MGLSKAVQAERAALSALSQNSAAWLISRTPRLLSDTDAPRNPDGSYNARDLVAWFAHRESAAASGDPMLTGDSPNLERYRKAKAELAEMDAAERRSQLADVGSLCSWWFSDIAPAIRQATEALAKLHGDLAASLITDAIDRASVSVTAKQPAAEALNESQASQAAVSPGMGHE